MKLLSRDLTIANRFIYYYANFVKRIYGFVVRREGKNVWTERQVGRLPARKPSTWPVPETQQRPRRGRPKSKVINPETFLGRVRSFSSVTGSA